MLPLQHDDEEHESSAHMTRADPMASAHQTRPAIPYVSIACACAFSPNLLSGSSRSMYTDGLMSSPEGKLGL